jgi:ubiquinone/menaquinone biosynthesis C-methylase UbiE
MERVPEPELMDDPAQAAAYARAGFAAVNAAFVEQLCRTFPSLVRGRVLDVGCGPADIPARLARARPELRIAAVDGSAAMLAEARAHVGARAPGIALVQACVPRLPFADAIFDAVVSNSLLHHLADPVPFWAEVVRVARRGAAVLVVDLLRPASTAAARALVDTHAAGEPDVLRRDFYNSLCAAFTLDEICAQVRALAANVTVAQVSDRHWAVRGELHGH